MLQKKTQNQSLAKKFHKQKFWKSYLFYRYEFFIFISSDLKLKKNLEKTPYTCFCLIELILRAFNI